MNDNQNKAPVTSKRMVSPVNANSNSKTTDGPENELQDVESTESGVIIKEDQPQTQNYDTLAKDQHDKDSDSHPESGVEQDERRKGHRERKSPSRSVSRSRSRSPNPNSNSEKGCCKSCLRENRPNGRACICQVPSSQRRSHLGKEGCITCRCTGCHPEDLEKKAKGETPSSSSSSSHSTATSSDRKSEHRNGHERHEHERDRDLKNGCCKSCMKAFSDNKRACLCQVPIHVRHGVLPPEGCKVCGCRGCHPEELLMRKQSYGSRAPRSDRMYAPPYDRYGYYEYPRGRLPPPYMEGPPPPSSYHDRDRDPYRMPPYPVRPPPAYYPPPHRSRYDHPPYHHEDSQRYPERPPSDRSYRRSRSRSREREPRKRDREREEERFSPKRMRENWRGE